MLWDDLKVVLNSLNILVRFDIKDVLFGILDTDNTSILVKFILLESVYFIYRCKTNKGSLCMRLLVDKLKKKQDQNHQYYTGKKDVGCIITMIPCKLNTVQ